MIPYVISEAHPDNTRPYMVQDYGVVQEDELQEYFLDKVSVFILERTDADSLKCCQNIENFFYHYYDEDYMDNVPWQVVCFINGKWQTMTPSIESIWEYIQILKLELQEGKYEQGQDEEKIDLDEEKEKEDLDEEHRLNLDEDEKETMTRLREYFQELVEDDPLIYKAFQEMNQIEQLTFLFSKITPEKYEANKKTFHNFINLCVKMIERDIKIITSKLEIEHNETLSDQLKQVMVVYSNAIQIKTTFGF
jgi:hypothetical protein